MEKGLLDLVEADALRAETGRDFFGPLHQNTQLVLERLLEKRQADRVMAIYRAAINHRLRAMKSETALWEKARKKHPSRTQSKWIRHYMPALRNMVHDYAGLLDRIGRHDPELEQFETAMKALDQKRPDGA